MPLVADTAANPAGRRSRKRRPALVAPKLQTVFALPAYLNASRLYRWLAQPVYRSRLYDLSLGDRSNGEVVATGERDWPADAQAGTALLSDEFRHGSEVVRHPAPLGNPPGVSAEWRCYLNRFDWLDHLRACGGPAARAKARQLVLTWLQECSTYDSFAWRADILAPRLYQLLTNDAFLEINGDALFRSQLLYAINRQCTHLARALPDGLIGAPLLKAGITLMLAGIKLPQGEGWFAKGRKILRKEIGRQILADGGHVERSPTVMLDLLKHLIDLRSALLAAKWQLPDQVNVLIRNLASAVAMLCHGDGKLALFNDSTEEDASTLQLALSRAGDGVRPLHQLNQTGFQRLEAGRSVLIQDCGAPPDHGFDEHAHAGTLSFEFSHGPDRLIINCGAHPVAADWRSVQRSTAAHSTLIVDDVNSSMLLPFGGMALKPGIVTCRREDSEQGQLLDTSHNGYEDSFGLVHRRRLFLSASGDELIGEDSLVGRGGNAYALRFHLHPSVQVVVTQNGQAALLKGPSGIGWKLRIQGGDLALADSIYLGNKGAVRRAQQLVALGIIESDKTQLQWALQREGARK